MQLSEFKAWFEGYTEGLESAPTKAQFDRIKEKVKEISGTPITYPVYIDRYVEPYRRYWGASWSGASGISLSSGGGTLRSIDGSQYTFTNSAEAGFDSHSAMYALGKAEASLAA